MPQHITWLKRGRGVAFGIRTNLDIIGYRSMALCTTCNLTIKS